MRDALGFLTVLPVGDGGSPGRGSLLAFPVVGALIGALWALAGWLTTPFGEPGVAAAAILLTDLVVTGGLHLDALADVADAVGSRRRGEEARKVLLDPAVGGVGAATLGSVLITRFTLLTVLGSENLVGLIGVPVAGRAAMVWATGRMPHGPGSLASDLHRTASRSVIAATALTAGLLAGLAARSAGVGVATLAVVAITAELASAGWRRRYGFPSGDAIGATGMVAETILLARLALAA